LIFADISFHFLSHGEPRFQLSRCAFRYISFFSHAASSFMLFSPMLVFDDVSLIDTLFHVIDYAADALSALFQPPTLPLSMMPRRH
jgi:hypothetical protein